MSNPGVITLAAVRAPSKNMSRFCVEDNIGEAIHVHWNNLRFDFSVREFLEFADQLENVSHDLFGEWSSYLSKFDPAFFFELAQARLISRIKNISVNEVALADLRAAVAVAKISDVRLFLPRKIASTPAYKFLKGDTASFIKYPNENYPGVDNVSRLFSARDMMTQQGYAANGEMIVLFAKNSVIRDGQHRAAILAAQYGLDHVIPVVVIDFHGRAWGYDRLRRIPRRYARALIHLGRRFARRLLW